FRFRELRCVEYLAFAKQHELLDGGAVRFDVQPVREVIERTVGLLQGGVDVERLNRDFADAQRNGRLCRCRCSDEKRDERAAHLFPQCYPLTTAISRRFHWTVTKAAGSRSSPGGCSPENRRS